ncbi:ADP-dependent glucokinase/phosphofructokinase [Oscillospiraceae bacterium PP1C4]
MAYVDNYQKYLETVPRSIEKCLQSGKKHFFGYTSNLDVILAWDAQALSKLIKNHLLDHPSVTEGETIDSMEDFSRIVTYYVINGLGGEIEVTSLEVCECLEQSFSTAYWLGGTCAQGASALNALGFPVVMHLTDKSQEVCSFLNKPGIYLVDENHLISAGQLKEHTIPIRHMILQYPKGGKIMVNGTEYEIPLSNRLIIDYDKVHKDLPVEKSFLTYCEEHADKLYSYNISGFNAIVDRELLKKRLAQLSRHYETIKIKNPQAFLYLESAHYLNTKCRSMVYQTLAPLIDILGMNEEELVDLSGQLGFVMDKDSLPSVLDGLELVLSSYHLNGIIMHTKDYSMYYGNAIEGIDIEQGLTLGNLMSGTRARTGRYGSYEDLAESLSMNLSEIGVEFARQLKDLYPKRDVCLVPSRYLKYPKCTIGLGDTFVAGMQICLAK